MVPSSFSAFVREINQHSFGEKGRFQMERGKIIFCGVAILSLLFIFSVPVTHADLEMNGKFKVKGNLVHNNPLIQNPGGLSGYIIAQYEGFLSGFCSGGYGYEVYLITDPINCFAIYLGWVDTCGGAEANGVAYVRFYDVPNFGEVTECYFNGPVEHNKKFKSVGNECDIWTYNPSNGDLVSWIGMSQKMKFQLKSLSQKKFGKKVPGCLANSQKIKLQGREWNRVEPRN